MPRMQNPNNNNTKKIKTTNASRPVPEMIDFCENDQWRFVSWPVSEIDGDRPRVWNIYAVWIEKDIWSPFSTPVADTFGQRLRETIGRNSSVAQTLSMGASVSVTVKNLNSYAFCFPVVVQNITEYPMPLSESYLGSSVASRKKGVKSMVFDTMPEIYVTPEALEDRKNFVMNIHTKQGVVASNLNPFVNDVLRITSLCWDPVLICAAGLGFQILELIREQLSIHDYYTFGFGSSIPNTTFLIPRSTMNCAHGGVFLSVWQHGSRFTTSVSFDLICRSDFS